MLEFSSTVLPAPSQYISVQNLNENYPMLHTILDNLAMCADTGNKCIRDGKDQKCAEEYQVYLLILIDKGVSSKPKSKVQGGPEITLSIHHVNTTVQAKTLEALGQCNLHQGMLQTDLDP